MAESWARRLDLHLDVDAPSNRNLLTSGTDSSILNSAPELIAGDALPVRLHFHRRGSTPGSLVAVDPGSGATIRFSGRAPGAASDALLFLTPSFTETEPGVWDGVLDLATQEIVDHLATDPPPSPFITCEVEIEDPTTTPTTRRSLQFSARLLDEIYANQDAPTQLPGPDDYVAARAVMHDRPQTLAAVNQTQARQNIQAAEVPTELDRDPINEDVVNWVLTGTLTSDGTTPLPIPAGGFIPTGSPGYWETILLDEIWSIGAHYVHPSDWYLYHESSGQVWYSQPGDELASAVWTPAGANTGTPVLTASVVVPKDTGRFALNTTAGTLWANLGDDVAPDWRQISSMDLVVALAGTQTISGSKNFTQFPTIPTTTPGPNQPVSRNYLQTQVRQFPAVNITATQGGVNLNVSEVAPSTWRLNVNENRAAPVIFRINAPGWMDWILGGYHYYTSNIAFRINAMFGFGVHLDKQERIMEWAITGSKHATYPARVTELLNVVTPFGSACPVTNAVITQEIVNLGKHDFIITASNGGGPLNTSMLVGLKPL